MSPARNTQYDVVVIGGGAAGLAGAVVLLRARRSVLVVDAGEPRNAAAEGVHNYLSREGTSPGEILAAGRAEVEGYGGTILSGAATAIERHDGGFRVCLADGTAHAARRLLVATGLVDELPDVPGVAERWGSDVLHCPYCHGWEVRDQPLGVLGDGPMAVHQALLWRQWSDDVVLFQHRAPRPTDDEQEQLAARGVRIVEGEVGALELTDDRLSGVRLASGEVVPRAALVVAPRFTARTDLLAPLGSTAEPVEVDGHVVGSRIPAGPRGATAVPGVWVAGNVADLHAKVISSAANGVDAGTAINADLIAEDVRLAVAGRRSTAEPSPTRAVDRHSYDRMYRSSSAVWSGRPNRQLVLEGSVPPPGTALDAGCGEGADALWLAERGWRVTAVDFSDVALARGAAHARVRGLDDRITWVHEDLDVWTPAEAYFDLVTAHYLHSRGTDRAALFTRLAEAVAPGGTLLVVGHLLGEGDGHHHGDRHHGEGPGDDGHHHGDLRHAHDPGLMYTAEDVAAVLDPAEWHDVVTETRHRDPAAAAPTADLAPDTVLVARRRSGAR